MKVERKFDHVFNGITYGLVGVYRDGKKRYYVDWASRHGKAKGQYGGGNIKTSSFEISRAIAIMKEVDGQRLGTEESAELSRRLEKLIVEKELQDIEYIVEYIHPFWQDRTMKRAFTTKRLANNFITKLNSLTNGAKFLKLYTIKI